jgi:ribonucleoside-diphosphate reductase beta chain
VNLKSLLEVPAIRRRIKYLEKSISNSKSVENRDYFESVVLFSMFVENVSLFSQFLVIMSFNKHKNMLKGISNAVEATSKEENITQNLVLIWLTLSNQKTLIGGHLN